MARKYFGTDGIRGPAGVFPLDSAGAYKIGKAVGLYFMQSGQVKSTNSDDLADVPYVLIGRDPRESSPMLETAVAAGLKAAGVRSQLLGILPTPGLMYLTGESQAIAGIMITASHNPYIDNGIKVVSGDGKKLPDAIEEGIDGLIDAQSSSDEVLGEAALHPLFDEQGALQVADGQPVALADPTLTNNGYDAARTLIEKYEAFLANSAGGVRFEGLKLAVDTANGATSGVAQRIFESLGATVTSLSDQPDGRNINVKCGATDVAALQAVVKSQGLDAGVAFDGDGDRVIMVDDQGRAFTGDHILYTLAVTTNQTGVVSTSMANMGLENGLKQHGISLHRTDVGDRYVLDGLAETGLTLGGEQSGHIIMLNLANTGDGILAAIQVLKQVQASGKSLAQWFDEVTIWPQKLINLRVLDKNLVKRPEVQAFIADQTAAMGDAGRLNIRPSGTEPIVRVMVEAPDAETKAPEIAAKLEELFGSLASV